MGREVPRSPISLGTADTRASCGSDDEHYVLDPVPVPGITVPQIGEVSTGVNPDFAAFSA